MIKITTWRPDTCGCELEYEWDDTTTGDNRVHTFKRATRQCPAHAGLTPKNCYNNTLDENKRKNILFGEILEKMPSVVQEKLQADGTKTKELKPGLEYKWSFDANRNLEVDLVGFSVAEKNEVKGLANLFSNKVKIK